MSHVPSQSGRRWGVRVWALFLLALCSFWAVRHAADVYDAKHLEQLQKSRSLNRLLWDYWGNPTKYVVGSLAGPEQFSPRVQVGPHRYRTELRGEDIDSRFAGWTLVLWFSDGPNSVHAEQLSAGRVIPPPGVVLQKVPSRFWWVVEYVRAIIVVLAMVGWLGCALLVSFARQARRQVAPVCCALSIAGLLAAELGGNFHWRGAVDSATLPFLIFAAFGIVSFLLLVVPCRRLDLTRCVACRYDLTGNESGICPECGTMTELGARQRRRMELQPAILRLDEIIDVPQTEADMEETETQRDEQPAGTEESCAGAPPPDLYWRPHQLDPSG